MDLTSSPPPTSDRAWSTDGVVTLRTPLGVDDARDAVRRFFDAIVGEDITSVTNLGSWHPVEGDPALDTATVELVGARDQKSEQNLTTLWRERFRKHDYAMLSERAVYRDADMRAFRAFQQDALPVAARYATSARAQIDESDIILQVPIVTHSIKNERLLPDQVFFWLRRDLDRYVIYRVLERVTF